LPNVHELNATLSVVEARIRGAQDYVDWQAVVAQLRRSLTLAERIRDQHPQPDHERSER
jgi:hypothetical protein